MEFSNSFVGHKAPVYALVHGMNAGSFLSGSGDGMVVRWSIDDPEQGEVQATIEQAVFALHLVERQGILLIGTEGGDLHVVDIRSRKEIHRFEIHRRGIFSIVDLADDRVVVASGDGTLSIWQLSDTTPRTTLIRHIPLVEGKIRDLAVAVDWKSLVVACGDGSIRVLDTIHFNEIHTLQGPGSPPLMDERLTGITSVAYHPSKPILLSGGKDGHLRAWHIDDGYRPVHAVPAHKGSIYRIASDPQARYLATASRDKTAKVWSLDGLDMLHRLDHPSGGHTHSVNCVLWVEDQLLTAGDDRTIRSWKIAP